MAKPITELTVTATERVSPDMVRVHFAGDLAAFVDSPFTDRYVKLLFGPDGSTDLSGVAEHDRPAMRTYTVLELDVAGGTLAIDFVVHGDSGVAGPWAAAAAPGATVSVQGPGGGYAPDPAADWHLLAGDEAAIPAIRQSLAALPGDAVGHALVLVEDAAHEQSLPAPAGVAVQWLHRDSRDHGVLADAVADLRWREGRVHAFVHGEAQTVMHRIRPHLFTERGVPRGDVSISGYWRAGLADEEFRRWKRELAAAEGV